MAAYKTFILLVALISVQVIFAKPVENNFTPEDSSEEVDSTKFFLILYTGTNFINLVKKPVNEAYKMCQKLLKDEELLASKDREVIEFKNNITKFLENYDADDDMDKMFENFDYFVNATMPYLELPKDKETPQSEFIVRILNKYKVKDYKIEFMKDFDKFVDNFKTMFEASKTGMKKPVLDWYEKFKTLNAFEEKFESFGEFVDLVD
ncbi:uncharacterized protein ACRADG_004357 [Cochliomyia hominivorax]